MPTLSPTGLQRTPLNPFRARLEFTRSGRQVGQFFQFDLSPEIGHVSIGGPVLRKAVPRG